MENDGRDVALPARALVALRRSLRKEAGPLVTIHTLHTAGFATGEALFESLAEELDAPGGGDGGPLSDASADALWETLGRIFRDRGWGTLTHRTVHDAVGLLSSPDWVEVGEEETESQPSCAFTSGLLAALLSRAAEDAVAVLEVSCRASGDAECRFAFGSEVAIHELYGHLLEDRDLDAALAAL